MSLKLEYAERAAKVGAKIAPLCREFGISRETGHKWLKRYREHGPDGLEEQSRRPRTAPLSTAEDIVLEVLKLRGRHPSWGAKKLVVLLSRHFGPSAPSVSTIERILRQFGRIEQKRAHRRVVSVVDQAPVVSAAGPNDVWSVDFKGWWRTLDSARCEPLTIRDAFSRMVLATTVMPTTSGEPVRKEFERIFRKYGIPGAIRCDNGSPFISVQGRGGLTKLSAWWTTLGIKLVRSRPGCPQDNGAHERMHRDLRQQVQRNPSQDKMTQQRACDRWRQEFNHVRPHEALGDKTPAELYKPTTRRSLQIAPYPYPIEWPTRRVKKNGCIRIENEDYFIGAAFVGLYIAFEPLAGISHRLWLCDVDLGKVELAPPITTIELAALNMRSKAGAHLHKTQSKRDENRENKKSA